MRQIFLEKEKASNIKLFDMNGSMYVPITFHTLPNLGSIQVPKTVFCSGDSNCIVCQLRNRLVVSEKYDTFKNYIFQVYQSKCNLDSFTQYVVPISKYDKTYMYGLIRLWSKQARSLIEYIISTNMVHLGDMNDSTIISLSLDKYGSINTIVQNSMLFYNFTPHDDSLAFFNTLPHLQNSVYNELNIVSDFAGIQTVGHVMLSLIKKCFQG